jgi:hypothetical protein
MENLLRLVYGRFAVKRGVREEHTKETRLAILHHHDLETEHHTAAVAHHKTGKGTVLARKWKTSVGGGGSVVSSP